MLTHFNSITTVISSDGSQVDFSELVSKHQYFGFYFSAHWCGPCRQFTPKLAEIYKSYKAKDKDLEIIFVSNDKDEESFKEYFNTMPWYAIPFGNDELRQKLSIVSSIPTLIIVDNKGKIITKSGRDAIIGDPQLEKLPWEGYYSYSQFFDIRIIILLIFIMYNYFYKK